MPAQSPRRYVTMSQIAEQYMLSPRTIRLWIAEGKIRAYRIGARAVRLDPDEVERLLANPIPTAGVGDASSGRKAS